MHVGCCTRSRVSGERFRPSGSTRLVVAHAFSVQRKGPGKFSAPIWKLNGRAPSGKHPLRPLGPRVLANANEVGLGRMPEASIDD